MKAWYLLYCKPRGEARAVHHLTLQNIESYLPTICEEKKVKGQISIKRIPLFPSYLFIHFDPQVTSVARIHSTRGVGRIIGCNESMTPIDDTIIHSIRMREHKLLSELLPASELSKGCLESLDTVELSFGDPIMFTDGPFAKLEGIFDEANGDKRCHVLFEIMGQKKRVSVPRNSIKPV
ncbi:transcription/translation regulatory transformer protein RfaH [Shewanella sp. VB17]|uniref:transcription/translation regulatory transformer protein RfaH n=1 Tax=Shewanella sp. VB17 TaxID=2739432 RepID=UPI0015639D40|nr:transcription/translation regulatory transformer protein RfaH [Shewanella sp. VB17]NRD74711.1 transcription/translation regulatory transformer protein RfaH [Shewanella sp. VB17]